MLFDNTIFDERVVVKQTKFFEYAAITVSLSINPLGAIKVWEHAIDYINAAYESTNMWDTDLE